MEATERPAGDGAEAPGGSSGATDVALLGAGAEPVSLTTGPSRPLARALVAVIGSRVLIFAVALLAAAFIGVHGLPVGWRFPLRAEVCTGWLGSLFNPGGHWDGVWYIKIATSGYADGDGSTAFFPLYPMLLRYLGVVLHGNLLISGSQEMRVNFELRALEIVGIVRPRDMWSSCTKRFATISGW